MNFCDKKYYLSKITESFGENDILPDEMNTIVSLPVIVITFEESEISLKGFLKHCFCLIPFMNFQNTDGRSIVPEHSGPLLQS